MTTPDPQGLVRCLEISRSDADGGYIIPLDSLHTHGIFEIECEPEDGVSITFTHCTRTQAELDALPEFDGW